MRSDQSLPPLAAAPSRSASPPAAAATTDSSSSSATARRRAARVSATLNGAGSTFAAPDLPAVGGDAQGPGPDGQLPGRRLRRGRLRSSRPAPSTSRGSDPRAEADEDDSRDEEGRAGPDPDRSSARSPSPTTSRGVKTRPEARRQDARRHLPRQGQELERPGDRRRRTRASSCRRRRSPSSTAPTPRARPRASPVPGRYSPGLEERPGVDKDVKWPTGTGAKGNDGVAAAVKQTDGAIGYVEQAYALQNNFTFADVKNKSGEVHRPDARVDVGRR